MSSFRRISLPTVKNERGLASIPMGATVAWSPQNTLSPEFMWIAGGLLLAVALLLTVLHRKQRKTETALTLLEDPNFISDIFNNCADQRLRVSITCSRNALSSTQTMGHLKTPEEGELHSPLTFVLSDAPKAEEWAEAPVDLYFHFTVDGEKTFYHFSSFTQSIEQKDGAWQMTVARPSVLTNNQRREFVRVEPPVGIVEAITAWPLPQGPLLTLPTMAHDLGKPPFAFRPPRVVLLEMMDISAGGMRIRLPVAQIRAKQVRCAPGVRFILLLAVDAQRADGGHQMLWVTATVRRAVLTPDKIHAELGLQYTHWAPAASLTDPIHWEPVEADGEVPFLLRWVSRVNALLSRLQ